MPVVDSLKILLKSNYSLFKATRMVLAMVGYFKKKVSSHIEESWIKRIETVILSPDNHDISRVEGAGRIKRDVQIMHNGLKIHVGSYYGDGNTVLLYENTGVHEPQEEKAFDAILELLPPNPIMLELGAFWGFYSMTFQIRTENGVNFLIEPDSHALLSGKNNFKLNKLKGHFFQYYISGHESPGKVPTITIDRFLELNNIARLNILHSDIQGFELEMLKGASDSLRNGKIDYLFISTHSNVLHMDCINCLKTYQYQILCDANLDETYSWDGLIVAKQKEVRGPTVLQISKKSPEPGSLL